MEEKRKYPRIGTDANVMAKVGLSNDGQYGFGKVKNISKGGLFLEADIFQYMSYAQALHYDAKPVILQVLNHPFSIAGKIVRFTPEKHIGILITSTTDDSFLQRWVTKNSRESGVGNQNDR